MKKGIVLILTVILLLATTAQAADPRSVSGHHTLDIEGTTATCSASYYSGNENDHLKVILTLWCGESIVATWSKAGYGSVDMCETCNVVKGNRYDLVMMPVYNGVAQETVTVSAYS